MIVFGFNIQLELEELNNYQNVCNKQVFNK